MHSGPGAFALMKSVAPAAAAPAPEQKTESAATKAADDGKDDDDDDDGSDMVSCYAAYDLLVRGKGFSRMRPARVLGFLVSGRCSF